METKYIPFNNSDTKYYFFDFPIDKTIYINKNKNLVCNKTGSITIYTLDEKIKYIGEVSNGEITGKGRFYYNNNILQYYGYVINSVPIKGRFYYNNGYLKCKLNNNQSEIYYNKLDCHSNPIIHYVGGILNNNFDGYGRVFYNNGVLGYCGKLQNGKPHGTGKYFYENSKLAYDGKFREGKFDGYGMLYSKNGSHFYTGIFKNDRCPGKFLNLRKKWDFQKLFIW